MTQLTKQSTMNADHVVQSAANATDWRGKPMPDVCRDGLQALIDWTHANPRAAAGANVYSGTSR